MGAFKEKITKANWMLGVMDYFKSLRRSLTAYKIDLPCEYHASTTFNVFDLSLSDIDMDSRTNPFKRGVDGMTRDTQEIVELMQGSITRENAKIGNITYVKVKN